MITVNTSYTNLINQHNLAKNTNALEKATERLSTGAKINHAVDDAAGLFIESGLSSQIASLKIANDNTLLATNFLNIANGTLTTVSDCLMRMNDLATQACNSTMSADARTALQNEMDSLVAQINQSIAGSNMNGVATITTGAGAVAPIAQPATPAEPVNVQKSQSQLESAGYVACTAENLAVGGNTKFYISSAAQLQALATFTNAGGATSGRTFTLSSDIDLSSVCSESKGSWTPIGSVEEEYEGVDYTNSFKGTFDGNMHVIQNMYLNDDEWTDYLSLFGGTYGAEIKNLGVENIDISVDWGYDTSGLIGYAADTTISNCYVTGEINGYYLTGGLLGTANNSSVTNCYTAVNVITDGGFEVGGLIGEASNSTISNCYTTGNVTGYMNYGDVGGITGRADNTTITNCYATGLVNGVQAAEAANKASFDASVLDDDMWDKTGSNPTLKFGALYTPPEESAPEPSQGGGGGGGAIPVGSAVIRLQVGDTTDASSAIEYNSAMALDLDGLDLSTIDNARAAMAKIQTQLETVTSKQSYIGTQINRLSNIYNAQQVRIENTSAARSTIMDTDYAKEVANMVKAQILQQISVSVLTQSQKISGQIALGLI